ncbi:MAG: DUF3037 domain-containing protein [Planctomycetia bacterium]
MKPTTGYYSLIQYCPDLARLEGANVGVLLFVPTLHYLKAVTSRNNRRVQQFFGRDVVDLERMRSYKKGVEHRVKLERPSIRTLEDLDSFIARRANAFRFTEPRPMKITSDDFKDVDAVLHKLFKDLVGEKQNKGEGETVEKSLARQFALSSVRERIAVDVRVHVPMFRKDVTMPFGYQNGRFNLIKPARFESSDYDGVLKTATYFAAEGRSLYESPSEELGDLQLVIVGKFPARDGERRQVVGEMFEKSGVRLFGIDESWKLTDEIDRTAKVLPANVERLSLSS